MIALLAHLLGQTSVDPIGDAERFSNALQKGGLAFVATIFVGTSAVLWRSREKLQAAKDAQADVHAKEIRTLNEAFHKAIVDAGEKARVDAEAKNAQIVGFVAKLTETIGENTNTLERLTEVVKGK